MADSTMLQNLLEAEKDAWTQNQITDENLKHILYSHEDRNHH